MKLFQINSLGLFLKFTTITLFIANINIYNVLILCKNLSCFAAFQIDMPVFFYIDPDFCIDPKMEKVDIITLSYTFFEAKEDMTLPFPKYFASQSQTGISNIS